MSRPEEGGGHTRLIVKNIPKYVDEAKLRAHFSQQGDVTDVKLQRTRDGKSRCFGFIGFKTPAQAQAALKFFHRSFLDTARLEVAVAESVKGVDKAALRPWSKHSEGSSAFRKAHGGKAGGKDGAADGASRETTAGAAQPGHAKPDPKLAEFLELMKPASTAKTFANSEVAPQQVAPTAAIPAAIAPDVLPAKVNRQRPEQGGDAGAQGDVSARSGDVLDESVSDLEYLRRRVKPLEDAAQPSGEPDGAAAAGASGRGDAQGGAAQHDAFAADAATKIGQTGRLFLRNLPFVTTDADLMELHAPYGAVTDATIVCDKSTGKSKGFALVTFAKPAEAVAAYQALDGSIFQGRLLHILAGNRPKAAEGAPQGDSDAAPPREAKPGTSSYKREAQERKKAEAGNRRAWSTLYMRDDTVAEAVAELTGVAKAELLSAEAGDAAVRLALGEAQVLAATKAELEDAGVNVAALEEAASASGAAAADAAVARSPCVLLLKNLPYACFEDELHDLVAKFGAATRVVLPSTRALALIELPDKQAARAAFRGLAYKRFHHVPLYLEYAPAAIFDAPAARVASERDASARAVASSKAAAAKSAETSEADVADDAGDSCSLFVKNLAFETSEGAVRELFDKAASAAGGALRAVRLVTAKRPDGKTVAKGYGFAECDSTSTARAVLKRLQGALLDGHRIELQLAANKAASGAATSTSKKRKAPDAQSSTKVLVRNLAFEAAAKDVRALMEAFGHVKTCRLPKKFDGGRRGFAFVEFATKGEAQRAVQAVHGTHLYGRRLLLEYAQGEEGLEELRARAAAKARREASAS